MSEKEQAQALRLLAEMVTVMEARALDESERALLVRAKAFLALPAVPESHGQRRS